MIKDCILVVQLKVDTGSHRSIFCQILAGVGGVEYEWGTILSPKSVNFDTFNPKNVDNIFPTK